MSKRLPRAVLIATLSGILAFGAMPPAMGQGNIDRLEQELNKSQRKKSNISNKLDDLGNRRSELEADRGDLNASLEGLDADIAKKVTELNDLQGQLPAAQQAVEDAESRVEVAAAEVASLNQRIADAESRRADIQAEIAEADQAVTQANEHAGQIASEAYKQGGVSANLSFVLGVSDSSLPEAMGLAQQAMRIQDSKASDASQDAATSRNAESRLEAVEEEIKELQVEAEAALAAEEQARDEATAAKQELDSMISTTEQLTEELRAERPRIQERMRQNEASADAVNAEIAKRQEELAAAEDEHSELSKEHADAVAEAERKRKEAEEAERKAREAERRAAEQRANKERQQAAKAARSKANQASKASQQADRRVTQTANQSNGGSSRWGLIKPINTYKTSGFGWRPTPAGTFDYGGRGGYVHTGIDYGGGCGIPIKAARSGTVMNADWAVWTAGRRVVINHGRVNGVLLATKYHHMTRYVVSPGQKVSQGQVIGYTGTTGNSTGCHLHFETLQNGKAVNPEGLL